MLSLATMATAGCTGDASSVIVPQPEEIPVGESGSALYRAWCSGCHGLAGEPAGNGISDLRDYHGAFSQFDSALTNGPGLMPRYPELDSAQRRRIYDHVLTFRR